MDFAIIAKGLSKSYVIYDRPADRLRQFLWHGRRQFGRMFHALSDVSFELRRGEVLGIVGRNGAGKSTLLQLVCGILQPSAGTLEVNGRVAALLELGAGFNPEFTGRENVFMNAALLGVSEDEVEEKFAEIVDFAELVDFIDQPVKTYSSGMYVRLAFSIATAFEPDILVIDEALSVGDGYFARKSFERIMALKEKGASILFCSHSMYQIDALCNVALWLDRGRVRMLDKAKHVTTAYGETLIPPREKGTDRISSHPIEAPGPGRILSIEGRCKNISGNHLIVHSREDDLDIIIRFFMDPDLPPPSIALLIETASGIPVSSLLLPESSDATIRQSDGFGVVTIKFPQIPLLKGMYNVSACIACERALHPYDIARHCITITVIQDDNLQGLVALPHVFHTQ